MYIALALFLGGLGIHNFYAGYAKRGIGQIALSLASGFVAGLGALPLYVIVAGGLWLWIILDMILVDEDAQGAAM